MRCTLEHFNIFTTLNNYQYYNNFLFDNNKIMTISFKTYMKQFADAILHM